MKQVQLLLYGFSVVPLQEGKFSAPFTEHDE
jgi:hypothetical protein